MAIKIISCVAVSSYQEINLKYVALYMCYKETSTYSYIALPLFLQEKLMPKINYFLCEYKQVSYVYCVSYNCCQQKKRSCTFLSLFFLFLKSKGVIFAEIFTFDFVLGWHKTWHFALKGLFSDSVFLCCGSKIMGIN